MGLNVVFKCMAYCGRVLVIISDNDKNINYSDKFVEECDLSHLSTGDPDVSGRLRGANHSH